MARSIAEEHVFASTEDCLDGIGELAAMVRRGGLVCHQFCLMPTHYHLLATFEENALVPCIQRLNRRYAGSFNRRHRRRGHVFDSPYGSVHVAENEHLFNVVPYIARNPSDHRKHPWSSYPGSTGVREPFSFVDDGFLIAAYGSRDRLRAAVEAWNPAAADLCVPGTSDKHEYDLLRTAMSDVPGTQGYSARRIVTAPSSSVTRSKPLRS